MSSSFVFKVGNYWVSKGSARLETGGYLGTKDLGFNVKYAS